MDPRVGLVNVAAAVQHVRRLRQFGRGEPHRPLVWSLVVVVTVVLAAVGAATTAYLFSGSP
jgi:hypothetical protein